MKVNEIDTRQATANDPQFSNGNVLPYTGVPFGMNYFTVQSNHDQGATFFDPRQYTFEGFRLTHQPSPPQQDFEHFIFTPIAGPLHSAHMGDVKSMYRPEDAHFDPHEIKLRELKYETDNDLIVSTYGGMLKTTYTQPGFAPGLFLRSPGDYALRYDPATQVLAGWLSNVHQSEDMKLKMYVAFHFDQPLDLEQSGFYTDGHTLSHVTELTGTDAQLCLYYAAPELTTVTVTMATSFIDEAQARLNLQRLLERSFAEQERRAAAEWQHYLDLVTVTDRDAEHVQTFYTLLYRCFLFPMRFYEYDANGETTHYDIRHHAVKPGYLFTNNGFWDTAKTTFPLYSLLIPDEYRCMLQGFLNSYKENGYLPKWLSPDERGNMPGTMIDTMIADAVVKDLVPTDLAEALLAGMIHSAQVQSDDKLYGRVRFGRTYAQDYNDYHYVPMEGNEETVSHTLDYSYSDFAIARVAEKLGKQDIAEEYTKRALYYRHVFDPSVGFMRAKHKDGTFRKDFDPYSWGGDYTEGSAWQCSFEVFHDILGLKNQFSTPDGFYQRLLELVNLPVKYHAGDYGYQKPEMTEMAAVDYGQLAISNQPSFHVPYLFTYVGHPEATQVIIRQLLSREFNSGYEGLPGDEDNGSMSAWYVFSSMGFYPVCPGSGEYVLGAPLFDKVVLHLPGDHQFEITATNNHPQNNFVYHVAVNGTATSKLSLPHAVIANGGQLHFDLGLVPTIKPIKAADLPYSLTK